MSTESYVIQVGRKTIGIAVRHRGDFRFYAAQSDYVPLEHSSYRRLRDVERAAVQMDNGRKRRAH